MYKNIIKYLIIVMSIIGLTGVVQGDVPVWDKTYGGSGNENAASFQKTSDGGYIIVGTTFTYGAGSSDIWLLKTDSNGTRLWDKTFGGGNDEFGASAMQTSDGGYIIAGTTFSYGEGGFDILLIRTDSEGNRQWDRTYGGKDNEDATSILQISDGSDI